MIGAPVYISISSYSAGRTFSKSDSVSPNSSRRYREILNWTDVHKVDGEYHDSDLA